MTDNLEEIGGKRLHELNDDEWKMILNIIKEKLPIYYIKDEEKIFIKENLDKQNEFGLYLMFGDTIKEAWKKAIK